MESTRFNVRVYGLLINDRREILVTDERRFGKEFTKFPGGGLEFGEGTIECLVREFQEELAIEIHVRNHFYTTDFFQQSAFRDTDQIISIYYLVEAKNIKSIIVKEKIFDFDSELEEEQAFRWIPLEKLMEEDVTFPIDKKVVKMLKLNESKLNNFSMC